MAHSEINQPQGYDLPLDYYVDNTGDAFYVVEAAAQSPHVALYASAAAHILHSSWVAKFVPDYLDADSLNGWLPTADQLAQRIADRPGRPARYIFAVQGAYSITVSPDPARFTAFGRVEQYTPKRSTPENPGKEPYPNITDLEVLNGKLLGDEFGVQALAVAYHMMQPAEPTHKASAYTERPNGDGQAFYLRHGFHVDTTIKPSKLRERIGSAKMEYVHMVAPAALAVQESLGVDLHRFQ